jgi:cellulose synthase operon protein C
MGAGTGVASPLKPELRARMAWLQARLAFESTEPERAIALVDALVAAPLEIDATLATEIKSTAILLKAEAEFALGREAAALETLKRLREEYRLSEAAVSSFLIESEHYAAQDKIDEARNRLIRLTDDKSYESSEYVPYALFRLALLSERLGREQNLREANKRIEDLMELAARFPAGAQPDLIFAARMKQGDIFRKLNDFPAAQRAYEDLVNRYSRRPDVVLAELALAETYNAQSSANENDRINEERAQHLFEQLRDRADAPADVRVEAGYNLGKLFERRGKLEAAAMVWWQDVIEPFLGNEAGAFPPGAKRPYWLARTLREVGDVCERLGRMDDAIRAYRLIIEKRLPAGQALAEARLQQLGAASAKAPP